VTLAAVGKSGERSCVNGLFIARRSGICSPPFRRGLIARGFNGQMRLQRDAITAFGLHLVAVLAAQDCNYARP
jgi:hypothetical protein